MNAIAAISKAVHTSPKFLSKIFQGKKMNNGKLDNCQTPLNFLYSRFEVFVSFERSLFASLPAPRSSLSLNELDGIGQAEPS